jgi:hypothetical protein
VPELLPFAVNVIGTFAQEDVGPVIFTVGFGLNTTLILSVSVHPLLSTVTEYVVPEVTVILVVVAPVLQSIVPPSVLPLTVSVILSPTQTFESGVVIVIAGTSKKVMVCVVESEQPAVDENTTS